VVKTTEKKYIGQASPNQSTAFCPIYPTLCTL
jgi:hypothetical protein